MKKLTLLLVAVACLCTGNVNAQDGKGSINFVPYVGMNYSNLSGDVEWFYWGKGEGKANITIGARVEFQWTDKSALLVDYNFRRLGANFSNVLVDDETLHGLNRRLIEDKVIFDCHSFGVQYKQNILCGLSARTGIELECRGQSYHMYSVELYDPETNARPETVEYDYLEGLYKEDIDDSHHGYRSDNVNIPLGLTYDYKNFSINATYHLPLTSCATQGKYSIRHQAFDLTIGYRLPLRKR